MKRYIFGAGIQGKAFLSALSKSDVNVDGFVDNFSSASTCLGLPIVKPEELSDKHFEILISVGLISHVIKKRMMSEGFTRCLDFTQSVLAYPGIIHELKTKSMWWHDNVEERLNLKRISEFKSLLSDAKSIELLEQIVRFRTAFKPEDYVIPQLEEPQYFPSDVDVFSALDDIRFVDAGAFTGDTLKALWNKKKSRCVSGIACFEPDTHNIKKLQETAKRLDISRNLYIYPAGLWSTMALLSFDSCVGSSSAITESGGNTTIPVVSLDDSVYHMAPNFVKMDIEGAECNALKGAKRIIKDFTPVLAISLYHKPQDLWEIPLLIREYCDNYDMYIRVYGDMLLETVLYCIPKKMRT